MNSKTELRLKQVNSILAEKAREIISILEIRFDCKVEITSGFRSFAEQTELYAQDRTKSGAKVTNAQAGQSFHNFGLAVDVVKIVEGKAIWTDENFWLSLRNLAVTRGLVSGYDWKFQDKPHVQLGKVLPKR